MEQQGFIKLDKNVIYSEWFSEPKTCHLFVHLLLSASPVDRVFNGKVVKKGQLLTTLKEIHVRTGISEQDARTGLLRLERYGLIKFDIKNIQFIITVRDFDKYCD